MCSSSRRWLTASLQRSSNRAITNHNEIVALSAADRKHLLEV